MSRLTVFLDDGGVISDNRRRGIQWQQLVGVFFAPLLGRTADAWAEANRVVAAALFEPAAWRARLAAAPDYPSFERAYLLDWITGMCSLMRMPHPSEERSLLLAQEAEVWITRRVDAAFPGAVETIRLLHARGYRLCTASGESSTQLVGYLSCIGVRECFGRLYGPDLINTFKTSPAYYSRLLADAVVNPTDAVIVDDSLDALAWAAAIGACPVYVGAPASAAGAPLRRIAGLADLPALLAQMDGSPTHSDAQTGSRPSSD